MDDLRRRVVRFRLRYERQPPDPSALGTVLERNGSGKLWQAVIQDPKQDAVAALHALEGVSDVEEAPLNLEELYVALLARKEAAP
jgi:hypothetical protein